MLKRRRATPVPACVLIAGRTLTAMIVSLVVMTVPARSRPLRLRRPLPSSTIPGVVLTAVVGSATFCVLGYALATVIRSADAAQPMVQAIMLPLYFISGVFIPNVNLPSWLRTSPGSSPSSTSRRPPPRLRPGHARHRDRLERPRRPRALGGRRSALRAAPIQLDSCRGRSVEPVRAGSSTSEVTHADRDPDPARALREPRNRRRHADDPGVGVPLHRQRRSPLDRQAAPVPLPDVRGAGVDGVARDGLAVLRLLQRLASLAVLVVGVPGHVRRDRHDPGDAPRQ